MKTWNIVPGAGEQYLETMSREVMLWGQYGTQYDEAVRAAIESRDLATHAARTKVNGLMADRMTLNFANLGAELDPELQGELLTSILATTALTRMKELRNGVDLGQDRSRAVLTVNEPGVVLNHRMIEPGHNVNFKLSEREMQTREVIEGRISDFNTAPRSGGRIAIYAGMIGLTTSIMTGLIDKTTGNPRVGLEIFEKR